MPRFSHPSFDATAAITSRSLAAAIFVASLMTWAAPAAAQGNCRGIAGLRHSVTGYDFIYVSRSLAQGANGRVINCVRNNNGSRGVFIDWKGSNLVSTVLPGGQIFTERVLGRTPTSGTRALFYGARPTRLDVATMVERAPATDIPGAHPLLRLAAQENFSDDYERPVTVPGEVPVGRNEVQVYVPVGPELNQFAATNPSRSALIEWLESHPGLLRPMAMTFDSRATPSGANLAVSYEVRYRLPGMAGGGLFLRFSDPELHNRLFNRPGPVPVAGAEGETVLRASLTIPRARVASRTARLEVVLANGALVAALPVTYVVAG